MVFVPEKERERVKELGTGVVPAKGTPTPKVSVLERKWQSFARFTKAYLNVGTLGVFIGGLARDVLVVMNHFPSMTCKWSWTSSQVGGHPNVSRHPAMTAYLAYAIRVAVSALMMISQPGYRK